MVYAFYNCVSLTDCDQGSLLTIPKATFTIEIEGSESLTGCRHIYFDIFGEFVI